MMDYTGERVRSNLRKFFWEILAQAAQDFSTLIDWAIGEYTAT